MNPLVPEEAIRVTPPPFVQKPPAYYSLEAAARRQNTPFLTRLKSWLTNRPGGVLDESTGGREMLSPDVFYKQAIEAPATQRPGGYDWLDSLAHTLTGAMIMRGGVEIPEWAQGHPMIKRYGALKERGILNEAEYEQGIKEQIAKLGSYRERNPEGAPGSVIDQLDQMAKTGARQTDAGTPVEALPLVSPGRGNIQGTTPGWDVVPGGLMESSVQSTIDWNRVAALAQARFAVGLSSSPVASAIRSTANDIAPSMGLSTSQAVRLLRSVQNVGVIGSPQSWRDRFIDAASRFFAQRQRPRTEAQVRPFDLPIDSRMPEFQRRFGSLDAEGNLPRRRSAVSPHSVTSDSPDWWELLSDDIMEHANVPVSSRQVDVDREVGRHIASLFGISVRDGTQVFRDFSRWSGRGNPGNLLEDAYSAMWYARYRPRNPR